LCKDLILTSKYSFSFITKNDQNSAFFISLSFITETNREKSIELSMKNKKRRTKNTNLVVVAVVEEMGT
jgi:hypothetical protein